MPAVDPARLAGQIEAVLQCAERPAEFANELADLVTAYTDRRRSGEQQLSDYRPNPVAIRTIRRKLESRFADCPESSTQLAHALWRHTTTRLFAPGMIKGCDSAVVHGLIHQWASETEEAEVLEELAQALAASTPWQRDEEIFFEWVGELEKSPGGSVLSLLILAEASADPRFEAFHKIIRRVRGRTNTESSPERGALIRLCQEIAARSPAELTKFLLSEFGDQPDSTRWLLTELENGFPERFRREIAVVLSTSGGTGIIRRNLVKD